MLPLKVWRSVEPCDVQPPEITPLLIVALAFQQPGGESLVGGAAPLHPIGALTGPGDLRRRRRLWLHGGGGKLALLLVVAGERRRRLAQQGRLQVRRKISGGGATGFLLPGSDHLTRPRAEHAIATARRETQRRQPGLDTLAVGLAKAKRRLRGFRPLEVGLVGLQAHGRLDFRLAAGFALGLLSSRRRGRHFSGGLALGVFDGPPAGSLLRLRLLAHFFLDLAPQGRFLVHLATSVGFGAQACGLLESRPLRSARLFELLLCTILARRSRNGRLCRRRWR